MLRLSRRRVSRSAAGRPKGSTLTPADGEAILRKGLSDKQFWPASLGDKPFAGCARANALTVANRLRLDLILPLETSWTRENPWSSWLVFGMLYAALHN